MNPPHVNLSVSDVTLRMMQADDIPLLRAIYQTNVPDFLPDDPKIVEEEINEESPNYLVVQAGSEVVAGAGIHLGQTGEESFLYMGIVHRNYHRRGLGTLLLLTRLTWTEGDPGLIWVMTHEKTRGFYERFGFERIHLPDRHQPYPGFTMFGLWLDKQTRQQIGACLKTLPFRDLTQSDEADSASFRASP